MSQRNATVLLKISHILHYLRNGICMHKLLSPKGMLTFTFSIKYAVRRADGVLLKSTPQGKCDPPSEFTNT